MLRHLIVLFAAAVVLVPGASGSAVAQETSLGPAVTRPDIALTLKGEVGPAQAMAGADVSGGPVFVPAERAAFFLAVDVRAARGNKNGFGLNEFVPYLTVTYTLTPKAGGAPVQGQLHPFVGRQGLRYGNNVPAPGPAPYTVTVTIEPPIKTGFGRHTDMETGVARWWPPFQMDWAVNASRLAKP
jgi:uncharacterized protein involved in high-affinity Fe2+ transport